MSPSNLPDDPSPQTAGPSGAPDDVLPQSAAEPLSEEDQRLMEAHRKADALLSTLVTNKQSRIDALARRLDLFAAGTLQIRTKDGGPLWPFVLNPIQMDYLASLRARHARKPGLDRFRRIRDLIVKPRQLGFSTFIAGLFFLDGFFSKGRITVVLTHKTDLSQELLRTYITFLEGLPEKLKNSVRRVSNSKYQLELEFLSGNPTDPPSRYIIATEAGEPWRGGVIHNLHASEAAWYKNWSAFKASFLQAVPQDGNIVCETTANGFNPYYQEVQDALAGVSDYRVVFYPWFQHPEYRRPWDPARQPAVTADERAVVDEHGLDLEQLAWRRWKQAELKDLFLQEYPETLLGAFLTTGRPVFDLAAVDRGLERAKKSPAPQEPRTFVKVWEQPVAGDLYLLTADVAEGLNRGEGSVSSPEQGGADFSAAYVFHVRTLRVVAAIHGRMPPVAFARVLDQVGRKFEAVIAVERNNHGHTVLAALEECRYPELYRHQEYNQATGQKGWAPGFPTTSTTRPLLIDALDEAIRRDALQVPDDRFWAECHAFHRNDRGRPESLPGNHDDRVVAAGIGVFLCTLGRSAWGVEGVDGADGAGFPRYKDTPYQDSPNAIFHQGDPYDCDNPFATCVSLSPLAKILGYAALTRPRGFTCGICTEFEAGPHVNICRYQRCRVKAEDPACQYYIPLEEWDDDEDRGGGFSRDEPWNVS